jgi:hypothetical protein
LSGRQGDLDEPVDAVPVELAHRFEDRVGVGAQRAVEVLEVLDDRVLVGEEFLRGELVGGGEALEPVDEVGGPLRQGGDRGDHLLEVLGDALRVRSRACHRRHQPPQPVADRQEPPALERTRLLAHRVELRQQLLDSLPAWGDVVQQAPAPPLVRGGGVAGVGEGGQVAVVLQRGQRAFERRDLQLEPRELVEQSALHVGDRQLPADIALLIEIEDAHDPPVALGVLADRIGNDTLLAEPDVCRRQFRHRAYVDM